MGKNGKSCGCGGKSAGKAAAQTATIPESASGSPPGQASMPRVFVEQSAWADLPLDLTGMPQMPRHVQALNRARDKAGPGQSWAALEDLGLGGKG